MNPKEVFVLLAFHAHEPIWDLMGNLQKSLTDYRMAQAVLPENHLRKRAKEGRNIYRDLMAFGAELNLKVTVDMTNELLHQIKKIFPRTFEALKVGYQNGLIYPLYTMAHHTHAALLTEEELLEEVRLNQEFLHGEMRAPLPKHPGLFFTENSVDSGFIPALERMGMEYTIFPHLSERKSVYALSDPDADYVFNPFYVGEKMIALPRHFPISQEIWRPITRWYPQELRYQGFLMGEYYVFDTEYREKRYLDFPIDKRRAIAEYVEVLRSALRDAPEGGLLLYIQDLELMDFGDAALEILREAWSQVRGDAGCRLRFVTPDEYLDGLEAKKKGRPKVEFKQIGWAPEIRLLSRSDGHYPPLDAGEFKGLDAAPHIFRKRPFIYWEPGRFITDLFGAFVQAWRLPAQIAVRAEVLSEEDYQIHRFPHPVALAVHLRLMKRACNWGWQPEEGGHKRPYLHGFMMADLLLLLLKCFPNQLPEIKEPLSRKTFRGLQRLPEIIVDTRVDYLTFGLERLRDERGSDPREALRELDYARDFREKGVQAAIRAGEFYARLLQRPTETALWEKTLSEIREHCRNLFLALDHIQRAWGKGGDSEFLVVAMYKYLYDLYPPRFPQILDEIENEERSYARAA